MFLHGIIYKYLRFTLPYGSAEGPPRVVEIEICYDLRMEAYVIQMT